jgi:hypothetical protein
LIVTLLASVFLLAVLVVLTFITGLAAITQIGRLGDNGSSGAGLMMFACGLVSLLCLLATVFFVWSVVKGIRDLLAPLHYTRGVVADKRVIDGRRAGTWLGVFPSYSGPDLAVASQAESPRSPGYGARSGETQGRNADASRKSSGYLSADRISADAATETTTRRIFRVDAASHAVMEAGDEVLVAHSRFLEHIFYVARLNGDEWESYKNKALI